MIIERELYYEIEPYIASPEAIVITGMRRVGKTTLLKYIKETLASDNTLTLDLENPLNQKYFEEEDFERIKFNFETLGLDTTRQGYVFLDEIQLVKHIPQVVKYLADHYQIKFFLTGSSSFYLRHQFSESLAGRKYIFELWPLNFREFLSAKQAGVVIPKADTKLTAATHAALSRWYEEYMLFGGFPGVVAKQTVAEKKKVLEDIFTSYFQLEVVQLGDFRKTKVMRDLMLLLMQRTGSKLDIQKISAELGISRPTVYEYIGFLAGTYFITLLQSYSKRADGTVRGAEKVYAIDSGLANHTVDINPGALFEQSVMQQLRPQGPLHYYQTNEGTEIDFILDKKQAFEVKLRADRRDVNRVRSLADKLGVQKAHVVVRKHSETDGVIAPFGL